MKKLFLITVLGMLAACMLALCCAGSAGAEKLPVTSLDRLGQSGISIAVGLDTPAETSLKQDYPEAKLIPYSDIFLAYLDVANGRVDACVGARREMELAIQNGFTGVRLLEETYASNKIAVGISPVTPIPGLKEKLNAFIAEKKADGTLDDMYDRWVVRGEETMPAIPAAESPAFKLRVGTTGSVMPYSYYVGRELAGYDIELAGRFAAWIGAELELQVYDFGGIIPAAEAGRIDCIMSNLFYTEEKDESIPFSDVLFEVEITAMVRDDGQAGQSAAAGRAADQVTKAGLNNPKKKIGVPLSSAVDVAVAEELPDAEVVRYNDNLLGYTDVAAGRLDAFIYDEIEMTLSIESGFTGVRLLDERMDKALKICVGISPVSKIPDLENSVNRFIAEMHEEGVIADMLRRWIWDGERTMPQIDMPENPQYHLTVGTTGIVMPYSYYEGTTLTGFDIELAYRFAAWLNADLRFDVYDYTGIVLAAVTGKIDVIMADLQYSDERAESGLIFSDELYPARIAILVRDTAAGAPAEAAGSGTFWDGIVSSFEKTFIREDRWRLFADGVLTTLLITVLAVLFGTLLGFAVFMLCRNGNPAANGVTRFCIWLVQGMPMVVLLMVLYYIIFGSVNIGGIAVAVTGFTLTFGAAVFGLLRMGVGAVDSGQYDAAYALGYSNRKTFFRIILPQALPHVMPAYRDEIVGLIKATSIVGYIAVQDLTKMADIVRSRTYEAFFPLIAVTVIYFALEGLIRFLVRRIGAGINPERRRPEDILKGIRTGDQE